MLPEFLTSEPRREYNFVWSLIPSETMLTSALSSSLWCNVANLLYISQLARQVVLPDETINLEEIEIGSTSVPIPVSSPINKIKVVYLDDTYSSVYNFHRFWMGRTRVPRKTYSGTLSSAFKGFWQDSGISNGTVNTSKVLTMESLYQYALGALYSDTVRPLAQSGLDVPTNGNFYPRIFPQTVKRSTMDREATDVGTVEVTYVRLPRIEGKSSYTWTPGGVGLKTASADDLSKYSNPPTT